MLFMNYRVSILFILIFLKIYPSQVINGPLVNICNEQIMISDIIDMKNFYKYSNVPNFYDVKILNNLINNKIIKAHYKDMYNKKEIKSQIDIQTKFIEKEIESYCYKILKDYFNNDEQEFIKQIGANVSDYINNNLKIQKEQLLMSLIMQGLSINEYTSPEKIIEFSKKHNNKNKKDKYEISELVIYECRNNEIDNLIKKIHTEITNKKDDFEKIIAKYSDKDINLGLINVLTDEYPFNYYLIKLKKNEISDIIKTQDAYYIIKWTEKNMNLYNVIGLTLYNNHDNNKLSEYAKKIANEIKSNKISWNEAVSKYSQNESNKNYYGVLLNNNNNCLLTKDDIPEADYNTIIKLKEGDISDPMPINGDGSNGYRLLYLKKIHKHDDPNNIDYDVLIKEYNKNLQDNNMDKITKNALNNSDIDVNIDLGYDVCRRWFINKTL